MDEKIISVHLLNLALRAYIGFHHAKPYPTLDMENVKTVCSPDEIRVVAPILKAILHELETPKLEGIITDLVSESDSATKYVRHKFQWIDDESGKLLANIYAWWQFK